jgi:hypothetical protein
MRTDFFVCTFQSRAMPISSSPGVEQFTISFRGSVNDRIPEGTYVVKVGATRLKLFVQPSGSDQAWNHYVAAVAQLQ